MIKTILAFLFMCVSLTLVTSGNSAAQARTAGSRIPAEVQRLMDLEEIRQLHLDYAACLESLDIKALMALFTDDAVLTYPKEYGGKWVGLNTIRRNFIDAMKGEKAPFNAIYVLTNPHITITGPNTAYGRWTFTNYLTDQSVGDKYATGGGSKQPLYLLGMYEDEYRRAAGRWKISRLKLTSFWPTRDYTGLVHP